MKISGFTMGKNARKLYYPMKQAVMSILPIVDEFVIVLGDSDEDDTTREEINSIDSNKIKIIDTAWDINKYPCGMEHAHQTDIAKQNCTGDWLFYLQSDEVVHEKYLPDIQKKCEELYEDKTVEGLLFNYIHFWGDYSHIQDNHCWYRKEIRIIRNNPDIHSWESAQSFRRIPDFNGIDFRQHKNSYKLRVEQVDAFIYHYGWVRPPKLMQNKIKAFSINHRGMGSVEKMEREHKFSQLFDYGNLSKLKRFNGSHPVIMKDWIDDFYWKHQLRFTGPRKSRNPILSKHDKLRYSLISWIEKKVLRENRLGEFKNYILIKH